MSQRPLDMDATELKRKKAIKRDWDEPLPEMDTKE